METRSSKVIEWLVRALVPPASREHVLGDLKERSASPRAYLIDALRVVPFVVASRMRRTTHPLGLIFLGSIFYWVVFAGYGQSSWLNALIPTVLAVFALMLRDAYRGSVSKWWRIAAVDTLVSAAFALSSQALFAIAAPSLLLKTGTLLVNVPFGFAVLFLMRLQLPSGLASPWPTSASSLSLQELRTEIDGLDRMVRRAVRVELFACWAIIAGIAVFIWFSPSLLKTVGWLLIAAGAAFVAFFLRRYAYMPSFPPTLTFAETVAAYRTELARRRRLALSYGWWYLLPLSVGPAVMTVGSLLQKPQPLRIVMIPVLVVGTIFGTLILIQRMFAAKAQERIDKLGTVVEKTSPQPL